MNPRTRIHRELGRKLRDIVGAESSQELAKLGLVTLSDLLRHVPRRYLAGTQMSDFSTLRLGQDVAVVARVHHTEVIDGRTTRVQTVLTDGVGYLKVAFFVPPKRPSLGKFWAGQLSPGARGIFVGKVSVWQQELQLSHPDYVIIDDAGAIIGRKTGKQVAMAKVTQRAQLVGLYPATAKMVTWKIADAIALALPQVLPLGDTLPQWVTERAGVLPLSQALREVHEPVAEEDARSGIRRLKFDEAFGMQLAMLRRRAAAEQKRTAPRPPRQDGLLAAFDTQLSFELTPGQRQVGQLLDEELAQAKPMRRLLQGEVGSGKTLVALRAMLRVVDSGGQAALLAPTEVLAKQHHAAITRLLGPLGQAGTLESAGQATQVALLTGSLNAAGRRAMRQAVADGSAGIVVGTHALLAEDVDFADLGLVVIDEQHRFGVEQRAALASKATTQPHTLVMTATPIPRSVAMTVFGDLEVVELRDRPAGRARIKTVFVDTQLHPGWVERAWQRIREEVAAGRQAFVVCPAITGTKTETELEPGSGLSAVTDVAQELAEGPLAGLRVAMMHGKQPATDRDQVMAAFQAGQVDVLVATTVIEVGIDVPNASVMVVLDADRFGIAQLHQLRGRIGRGQHPGLCLLLAGTQAGGAQERLRALEASTDGFELAERDLELRREGDVLGVSQSGASSLKLLRVLADRELIELAKEVAAEVVSDPRGEDPLLLDLIDQAEALAAGDWLEKG